jgi:hypothetical protein
MKEYNIIIFTGDESLGNKGFITYHKCSDMPDFFRFRRLANSKYPNWKWATVFDKITKEELCVIKPTK